MTGETDQERDAGRNEAAFAGTATKKHDQDNEARVGKYGGDDGALEHENTEIEAPKAPDSKPKTDSKPRA